MSSLGQYSTISICSGLKATDRVFQNVNIEEVSDYLKHNKECYERTQPTEAEPLRILNRVYIDLDGILAKETSEKDFDEKVEEIISHLTDFFNGEYCALKESCKWRCPDDKGNISNKLSFTIHFKNKCGSKKAILRYVENDVYPRLKRVLNPIIELCIVQKKNSKEDYMNRLSVDLSVYNDGQRKMRMVGQSKPLQNRPYKLIYGDIIDSLITHIPIDCQILPEVQNIQEISKKLERKSASPMTSNPGENDALSYVASEINTFVSNDDNDVVAKKDLIRDVLEHIGEHRWNYYPDWIRIGFIMFNEGFTLSEYTELSKKSDKWTAESPRYIRDKWLTFKQKPLSQTLLWKWLSDDNPDKYTELSSKRLDFWELAKRNSQAEVAQFFYNLKPDSYKYNKGLGWFQAQPTGIWKQYDKYPSSLISEIFSTLKPIGLQYVEIIKKDIISNDDNKSSIAKTRMKHLTSLFKSIGTYSFNNGVIQYLQTNYDDDDLPNKMDEIRHLFAFNDKVYDLDKLEVRDIKPDDYICINTNYPYPTQRYPEDRIELIKTLNSIFEKETTEIIGSNTQYFLKTIALALHGRKKYEKFFVWTGSGGNGKSLVCDIIQRVLGDYYHTIPHQVLTKPQEKRDATNPPLVKSKGKRFVIASEPEATDKLQVGEIKLWTGNDTLTGRDLHKSTISFIPQFILAIMTNNIPELNRPDGGAKRRLEVKEFPNKFVSNPTEPFHRPINIDLKEKIVKSEKWRAEMWFLLLDAYNLLQSEGLTPPPDILTSTQSYMDNQNILKVWLDDLYDTDLPLNDRRFQIQSDKLRNHYNQWAMRNKKTEISRQTFSINMEALNRKKKEENKDFVSVSYVSEKIGDEWRSEWKEQQNKTGVYYCGLKLKNAPMPPQCLL